MRWICSSFRSVYTTSSAGLGYFSFPLLGCGRERGTACAPLLVGVSGVTVLVYCMGSRKDRECLASRLRTGPSTRPFVVRDIQRSRPLVSQTPVRAGRRAASAKSPQTRAERAEVGMKLNLGCGLNVLDGDGWVNVDHSWQEGMVDGRDMVVDLSRPPYPWASDSVDQFFASHLVEHIGDGLLDMVGELWRVAVPGAGMMIRCPHGASDDAWEDPTHVRSLFPGSFLAWGQPYYWRSDYGYKGDWKLERVELIVADWVRALGEREGDSAGMKLAVMTQRNSVAEMIVSLTAVKPARESIQGLLEPIPMVLSY